MLAAFSEIHLDVSRQNAEGGYGEEGGAVGRELQVLDARTVAGEHGDRADHDADIPDHGEAAEEHRPRQPHVAEAGLEPEEGADGSHTAPAEEDDVEMDVAKRRGGAGGREKVKFYAAYSAIRDFSSVSDDVQSDLMETF